MKFSTYDIDNDLENDINVNYVNCASYYSGGWWYNSCHVYIFLFLLLFYF